MRSKGEDIGDTRNGFSAWSHNNGLRRRVGAHRGSAHGRRRQGRGEEKGVTSEGRQVENSLPVASSRPRENVKKKKKAEAAAAAAAAVTAATIPADESSSRRVGAPQERPPPKTTSHDTDEPP